MGIRKPDPVRYCRACGKQLVRKRYGKYLETYTRFIVRLYCGEKCMGDGMRQDNVTLAGYRSRAKKLRGDRCEECGVTTGLHAHHRDGDPSNNAPSNIQTLCASCHLRWHWRHGKKARPRKPCMVDGCERFAQRRCFCGMHFHRWKRWGDPHLVKVNQNGPLHWRP